MRRNVTAYFCDSLLAREKLLEYPSAIHATQFSKDTLPKDAVMLRFGVIGEAVVQIRHRFPADALRLGDVQGVVDFRNYLVHRCHSALAEAVWDVLENDLQELNTNVRAVLGETQCR